MFNVGTHIMVRRSGYTHHGIYIGNNEVIEYGGFSKPGKKDKVRLVSLEKFCDGCTPFEYEYSELLTGTRYSKYEIVERAKSRLGEDGYNLIFNNCEHFANWCTHGDKFSMQTSGTVEMNCRQGNYCQAGGLTLLDFINIFK